MVHTVKRIKFMLPRCWYKQAGSWVVIKKKIIHLMAFRRNCCERGKMSLVLQRSCRLVQAIPFGAGAGASAVNRGVWWRRGGSDDSHAYCVPANLACNLCHMSSRLAPIFAACLCCQQPKTAETREETQEASRTDRDSSSIPKKENYSICPSTHPSIHP